MSSIHETIKIQLSRLGYLPNYPYHMISDAEMCEGFISSTDTMGYFFDYYPLLDDSMSEAYEKLISAIRYYTQEAKNSADSTYRFPDWVYAYMVGAVISIKSDPYDITSLANMLNIKTDFGVFSSSMSSSCYKISDKWLKRYPDSDLVHRPPTLFGEPHVLKYLRLLNP